MFEADTRVADMMAARASRRLGSSHAARLIARSSSTFYDSQSGRNVTLPTGAQCHVGLKTVPTDRISSALAHLLKDGTPVRGLASVCTTVVVDEPGFVSAAKDGHTGVLIEVSSLEDSVSAVEAAVRLDLRPLVLLPRQACLDPHEVQLSAATLGDAGAAAILLSVDASADWEDVRTLAEMAWEIDLLDAPMRARLGLCVAPQPPADALRLIRHAHEELEMQHFYSCLAGVHAPKPTDVLKACGIKPADMATSALMLAEFVPDAA